MSARNNESGVTSAYFRSTHLIAARALSCKDWERPKSIMLARKMAHDGFSFSEIRDALGWACTRQTVVNRLRKYNICPIIQNNRRHRGLETSFPESEKVSVRSYRPKMIGAKR